MSGDAFILKIQRECHLKCDRKVSGPSKNRPQTRYMFSSLYVPNNDSVCELGSFSIDNRTVMTTPLIKNLNDRVWTNKRAARATRTNEQSRAFLCKTTTSNYQICGHEENFSMQPKKIFNFLNLI